MSDKYNPEEQSVLQKIQNQTGCLLLVIGVAMLAFVLTDLISSGSSIFGSDENAVGEIANEKVSYEEFNATFENLKNQLIANNPGIVIDENIAKQYQNQAWNMVVESRVIEPQYEELGISVSPAELEDLTIGDNTHPQIQQSFQDPETKQFDKQRLTRFLKEDINTNPDALKSWNEFQDQFTRGLIAQKYNQMIGSSVYFTNLESKYNDEENEKSRSITVVSLPFNEYEDSTLKVSDEEILAYIKKSPKKYEEKASRDIEFIRLNVTPSKEDSSDMMLQMVEIAGKFKESTDDSVFVSIMNSEIPYSDVYQQRGSFSPSIEDAIFSASVGDVLGPFQNNGTYSVLKLTDIGTDSLYSVRGSHILFNVIGEDTAQAEQDAQELIAQINNGETTFEAEADKRNYDATRGKGGDMVWIRKDNTVYPKSLVDHLFSASVNSLHVVRTNKGVYIAKATEVPNNKTVQIAQIDQTIFPSTKTDGEYYRIAGNFIAKVTANQPFEEVAEELGLTKRVAYKVNEEFLNIPGVENPNSIAKWLFSNETKENDISEIIEIDGSYYIAQATKIRQEGLAEVDDIRPEVETILLNMKKADILAPRMEKALIKAKDADALANALKTEAIVVPAATFNNANLPNIGEDKIIVGTIFGLKTGATSKVIKGENAVAVVYINNENEFKPQANLDQKNQMMDQLKQNFQQKTRRSLEEKAEISDWRYRFYN